ncbi:MAG: histidinol-phosphate transaminase [Ruminococcaceae bacterium]|nr:histidinol-phosphate transaminase [Oscillospiraceae bacterium]
MSIYLDSRFSKLIPYAPGEQPKTPVKIKLNTNESPFPPSPKVRQAVMAAVETMRLYPDPTASAVIEALAQTLGVRPGQVTLGNGSDEILAFCFQALCPNGVAFPDISYGFYPVYAQLYQVDIHTIPLRDDFTLAVEDYAGLGRTIVFANPNAPTGLALSRAQIATMLETNPGSLVIVDEAYIDFGAESAIPLLEQYDNLMVVGTFSKSRAMAGARLGYAVASEALIADLNLIKYSFNPYNLNRMTLAAGAAVLEDASYFEACAQKIINTRIIAKDKLEKSGYYCTDSMANFIFVSHPEYEAEVLQGRLRAEGILVRWFNQSRIKNWLRITIGTETQMDELVKIMDSITNK